jgi:hypothetical protein
MLNDDHIHSIKSRYGDKKFEEKKEKKVNIERGTDNSCACARETNKTTDRGKCEERDNERRDKYNRRKNESKPDQKKRKILKNSHNTVKKTDE